MHLALWYLGDMAMMLSNTMQEPTIHDNKRGTGLRARLATDRQRTSRKGGASMDPSRVIELNAFVPARDFALSKQFYSDLGFALLWGKSDIAQFGIGVFTFLLQKFHVKEHSANFMMALMVEDADAWWEHIKRIGLAEKYPGRMLKPPTIQPWGIRVLYLSDPSGVLWHIQDKKKA